MRTIQEIKDQLFLVSVKEQMCDNIQERSKIVSLCAERNASHYTQLREYLHCTKRQVQVFKMDTRLDVHFCFVSPEGLEPSTQFKRHGFL